MAEYAQYNWQSSFSPKHTPTDEDGMGEGGRVGRGKNQQHDPMQNVQAVRSLIPTRPDVGFIRTDEEFILRFLHARKHDVEESFALYANYYSYRQRNKPLFTRFNIRETAIRHALCDGFPGILPQKDHHGRTVLVFFTSNWDHSKYDLVAIYRALLLSLEQLIREPQAQLRGFVVIVDWSEFSFRQSSHLSPSVLRLMIEGLQDCFPARFKGVHFVGQPWYVEAALALIRRFLKDKTRAKIFLHGNNLSTLHSHVTRDILPAELGGEGPSYHSMTWAQQMIDAVEKETNGIGPGDDDLSPEKEDDYGDSMLRKSETFPATSFQEG